VAEIRQWGESFVTGGLLVAALALLGYELLVVAGVTPGRGVSTLAGTSRPARPTGPGATSQGLLALLELTTGDTVGGRTEHERSSCQINI
jgi:hypothetical protein